MSLLIKKTIVRYRKKMVNAEQIALHELIAAATCSGATNNVNNLARICHVGFPGG
jgi:hypothetical protein